MWNEQGDDVKFLLQPASCECPLPLSVSCPCFNIGMLSVSNDNIVCCDAYFLLHLHAFKRIVIHIMHTSSLIRLLYAWHEWCLNQFLWTSHHICSKSAPCIHGVKCSLMCNTHTHHTICSYWAFWLDLWIHKLDNMHVHNTLHVNACASSRWNILFCDRSCVLWHIMRLDVLMRVIFMTRTKMV